jgi:hypothetical protein
MRSEKQFFEAFYIIAQIYIYLYIQQQKNNNIKK